MNIGLKKCPDLQDLEEGYQKILAAQKSEVSLCSMTLDSFADYCQWSRFDSRMGEICVRYLFENWKQINPVEIHEVFLNKPWPAILGVLLEFCQNKSSLFNCWKKTATCGFKKANWEQFFIGKRKIGGQLMFDDARFSIKEYKKWGYLGREVLVNKGKRRYSPENRIQILKDLLATSFRVTTETYWNAIERSISRRQAERDLQISDLVTVQGNTKGRVFLRK